MPFNERLNTFFQPLFIYPHLYENGQDLYNDVVATLSFIDDIKDEAQITKDLAKLEDYCSDLLGLINKKEDNNTYVIHHPNGSTDHHFNRSTYSSFLTSKSPTYS